MVKSGVKDDVEERVVIVAVKASKEISKSALIWALTHVVQPGDYAKLLVVIPTQPSRKLWKAHQSDVRDKKGDITESCSEMILQLHNIYDSDKIKMRIKVVSGTTHGVVAAEAKKTRTQWVVLDQNLNKEAKTCIEDLECNVVVINKSGPKVLRLNLVESPTKVAENLNSCIGTPTDCFKENETIWDTTKVPNVTPVGSPEHSPFTTNGRNTSSLSSLDLQFSPFFVADHDWDPKKPEFHSHSDSNSNSNSSSSSGPDCENICYNKLDNSNSNFNTNSNSNSSSNSNSNSNSKSNFNSNSITTSNSNSNSNTTSNSNSTYNSCFSFKSNSSNSNSNSSNSNSSSNSDRENTSSHSSITDALGVKFSKLDNRLETTPKHSKTTLPSTRHPPHKPPPLCSICQHNPPVAGIPPKLFLYNELEDATEGFSNANFLAEGGFGSVHRGVLKDNRMVAVKQYRVGSVQGDNEFYSEVECLSCAQHRNIVMLVGYCVDDDQRLLVYEYVCNGSLDSHLYGQNHGLLEWSSRQKIAIGVARGLRYLHEECRVGCIVHRDMRPNNILLTHDFEALVGDFGLARWQPDGESGSETKVIGMFGYLAPEYAKSGEITEKADVYSFGVVLIELITGRKAVDMTRPRGQQCLTKWARPLLKETAIGDLIDPQLKDNYTEQEVRCMSRCAWLCIARDPLSRPRMSQVLWMLENNDIK